MSTIERTISKARDLGTAPVQVRPYGIVRSRFLLMLVQAPLFLVVLTYWTWTIQTGSEGYLPGVGLILAFAVCAVSFCAANLDRVLFHSHPVRLLAESLTSLGTGLIALFVLFQVFPRWSPAQYEILGIAAGSLVLPWVARALGPKLARRRSALSERWLILGDNELAARMYGELQRTLPSEVSLISPRDAGDDGSLLVACDELREWSARGEISRIIIADVNTNSELSSALVDCKLHGVKIEEAIDCYERLERKIWLEALRREWLVLCDGFRPSWLYMHLKRSMDIACALVLLAATLPLIVVIAILVRWTSPGPAFFRQERVGLHGKPFVLVKFRSMRQDAEKFTGPVWAGEEDDRATLPGRWLRKTRLDEIPQVWNVLRGEMSFIGPRPERGHFVAMLNEEFPYYDLRHYVRPGITGWAQVRYSYGASIADAYEKLQYELYYVKHLSFAMDFEVLARTVKIVLLGRGR